MSDDKADMIYDQSDDDTDNDDVYHQLIVHISEQNRARATFFQHLELGEPIWEFLLDLCASEHVDRPSSKRDIAQRMGISESLCQRCANYLIDRDAIFENRNQYTAQSTPWLVCEDTKKKMRKWLADCIANAPLT